MADKIKSSTRCRYLLTSFWMGNQFWEIDGYPESAKEYYRKWLAERIKKEQYLPNFEKK